MRDHSVALESVAKDGKIVFADTFNVAVPFIDRHLDEGRADKIIIETNRGVSVTFGELAERVNRCGNALIDLGIGRGDRVLMMVKDCAEFFYTFWGAIKAGIVPVPINTLLRAKDYQYMIEDSGCAAVVYSPEFASEVEPALAAASHRPQHAICVEGSDNPLVDLIAAASPVLEAVATSATDECFWLYSSGSTGSPKGAVHLHRDMVVSSELYGVRTLGVTADDICFSAAKLFFAYGLGNGMTFPLWTGCRCALFDARPTPETTFEMIEQFRPTLYFGVPTLYAAQLQALDTLLVDMSSVRYCVSAGEALPADIFNRWKKMTGKEILDGIGSTEALHIFLSNRPGEIKAGTSGKPVLGYDCKIVGEDGSEVAVGESGQLLIRGDSTAKYYWNNPEKTAQTMVDGWLNTGDTYIADEAGYYHYCGRNDDMLKVGGIWCSPFEIEAKLIEHEQVLEAAIVGREDDRGLIKPEAWIVLTEGTKPGPEIETALLELCKKGLAPYKYPRWFNFVAELPKTATGKIQRFKLRTN